MTDRLPLLTFYTKEDCHLCEKAYTVVESVSRKRKFIINRVDIEGSKELMRRFGEKIPMIFIDDKPAFKYRVGERELIERLDRASKERSQ